MKPRSESMSSIRKIKKNKKRVTRKNLASFRGLLKPPAMRVRGLLLDYGLSESISGLGLAFVHLGSILGRAGWGIYSDRFLGTNRKKVFLFMGFLFFINILIFVQLLKNINHSLGIIFLLAFLLGCTVRGWNGLFFSSVHGMVKEEQVGGAIGLSMFFTRIGMLLAPPIFGYIADLKGTYTLT